MSERGRRSYAGARRHDRTRARRRAIANVRMLSREDQILDDAVRQATWDLAAQQEAWIVEQARLLGITVEELAEDYYLEVENLGPELTPVPGGRRGDLSARQQIRLRRRDDP